MLGVLFTINRILLITLILTLGLGTTGIAIEDKPIIITSKTLIANNKTNTVIFEGDVVAKDEDLTIYSDKMVVSYNNSLGEVTEIHAYGNVRAVKDKSVIFSKEATYLGAEGKIVFKGEPKAVEGENVITGTEIVYYIKTKRTIVKGSRVFLKKEQGSENAFTTD
jgi:lipopolysaccharide export system protein LptA